MDLFDGTCSNFFRDIQGKKCVLFGAHPYLVDDIFACLKNAVHFSYIVDNDSSKWGRIIQGRNVYSPDKLRQEEANTVVVLFGITTRMFDAERQLLSMGIKDYYFFVFFAEEFEKKGAIV